MTLLVYANASSLRRQDTRRVKASALGHTDRRSDVAAVTDAARDPYRSAAPWMEAYRMATAPKFGTLQPGTYHRDRLKKARALEDWLMNGRMRLVIPHSGREARQRR